MSELPPQLQALVDNARRAHDPSQDDRERVYRALSLTLGSAAVGGAALTANHANALSTTASLAPVAAQTSLGLGLKATLAMALALAGVGVSVWATTRGAEEKVPVAGVSAQVQSASAEAEAPAPGAALARARGFAGGLGRADPASSRALTPIDLTPTAEPEPTAQALPAAFALDAQDTQSTGEAVVPSVLPATPSAPGPTQASPAQPSQPLAIAGSTSQRTRRIQSQKPSRAEPQATRTQQELELVRAALTALRDRQPARALQFLESHAQQFPHGSMVRERLGLRVVSLCELGRSETGRKEQAAFLQLDSTSPLAKRVRGACGNEAP